MNISEDKEMPNRDFVILHMILHIVSYFIYYFRLYDIKLYGKPDINGVYYARRESFVSNCETFVICVIIGVTLKHLYDEGEETFYDEGLRSYFLIFDSVLTFFFKAFMYFGLKMKLSGELTKNLYTLY